MTEAEVFIFGWVSTQVAQNFAAWATEKEIGSIKRAEKFFASTAENHPHEDWFCIPLEA